MGFFFKDCGCGCDGKKAEQKFLMSILSGLVFYVISNPDTFRLTRSIFGKWVSSGKGCSSMSGLTLHTIVFMIIAWGIMHLKKKLPCDKDKDIKDQSKILMSVMLSLAFFIFANPETFRMIRVLLGKWVASPTGCPTKMGLLLHSFIFTVVACCLMCLKREGYITSSTPAPEPAPQPAPQPAPEEIKDTPSIPPKMVDFPCPLPGFKEANFPFHDTGLELGSMDILNEIDLPVPVKNTENGESE